MFPYNTIAVFQTRAAPAEFFIYSINNAVKLPPAGVAQAIGGGPAKL